MKKVLLVFLAGAVSMTGYAKRNGHTTMAKNAAIAGTATANKVTAIGDTLVLSNITAADTITLYYADTTSAGGYVSGTDEYGDRGFAERYDFNNQDSSVVVIGTIATFGGTVNPASTKTVSFKVWDIGSQNTLDPNTTHYYYSGLPNNVLDSVSVGITHLGINPAGDTQKYYPFPIPTNTLTSSFYIGYDISYDPATLNGDTIGLYMTKQGERTSPIYTVVNGDTTINVQNATQFEDGSWNDNLVDNFGFYDDFAIFPVVVIHNPVLGVQSVTNKNLTFFGNYPNPAVNSTNITFSLATATDVNVQVTDMSGREVSMIKENSLSAGQHTINVATASLPAGDYLYILHTSNGDGIASKITVIK